MRGLAESRDSIRGEYGKSECISRYHGARQQPPRCEEKEATMKKWVCTVCGWEYDPEVGDPDGGIEPGTAFEDIPDDWVCPLCGASKDDFELVEE